VLAVPVLQVPTFSWAAAAELVPPLAVTVVFVQNAQGMAVLAAAGHRAPMRFVTIACGLASLPAAAIGAVSSCLTGPTNALLTASGRRERHYAAGIVCGVVAVGFGVLAPLAVALLGAAPAAFVAVLAGLALLRALQGAFAAAFAGPDVTAPLLTFLVTASGVTYLSLGAPFWGLVTGVVATWLTGRGSAVGEPEPHPGDERRDQQPRGERRAVVDLPARDHGDAHERAADDVQADPGSAR
jgi:benzoate membrane transport protein